LGSTLTTDLPEFDSSLGTLTDVTITLNLDVAPFASMFSTSAGQTFDSNESISYEFDSSINTIDLTRGADSWTLTTPTVSTGTIFGSGETIPVLPGILNLSGGTSASVNETVSGVTLAEYIGSGTLSFGTAGIGQVASTGLSSPVFVSGGGDLTGTASVVYEFTAVPEPSTLAVLGIAAVGMVAASRRRKRRAA
jgi:hypothetical protein